jgi:hypothetical protein
MLAETEASRWMGATNKKIVPFVSHLRETNAGFLYSLRRAHMYSRAEIIVELLLVAAGIAGIITGVIAM